MNDASKAKTGENDFRGWKVQLYGLVGIVVGVLVLLLVISLLRQRIVNRPVNSAEIVQYSDSPCMREGIAAATKGGKALTYGTFDRLKSQCGEGE